MVWVLGFTLASFFLVVAFITVECGRPFLRNLVFGISTMIVLAVLAYFLYLEYPNGLLPDLLGFPWWLR